MSKQTNPWEATSWDELKKLTTLEETTAALRAREVNRLAHKKHYLRRQSILEKAKAAGITA